MFLTQETPAKVLSLVGASLFSMFFLFAVSNTNASFTGTESSLPDIASPARVMSVLDNAANSYSNFVDAYLVKPGVESYAFGKDNLDYIIDEAGPQILAISGFDSLVDQPSSQASSAPRVAGAYTEVSYFKPSQGFSVDTLYSILIR